MVLWLKFLVSGFVVLDLLATSSMNTAFSSASVVIQQDRTSQPVSQARANETKGTTNTKAQFGVAAKDNTRVEVTTATKNSAARNQRALALEERVPPETFIMHSCKNGLKCGGFGTCQPTGETCECWDGYTALGKQCVRTTFTSEDKCQACGDTAVCVDESCKCFDGTFAPEGAEMCAEASYPDPECRPTEVCSGRNGVCDDGQCHCLPGYFASGQSCVKKTFKLKRGCQVNSDCGPAATCGFECTCQRDFFAMGMQCVSTSFKSEGCSGPCGGGHGLCVAEVCRCDQDYVAVNEQCVTPVIQTARGDCLKNSVCGGGYGLCEASESTCRCLDGFFAHNGVCASSVYEDDACRKWNVFSCSGGYGECNSFGLLCHCLPSYFAIHNQCVSMFYTPVLANCSVLQPCFRGVCYTDGDTERCRCDTGFVAISGQCAHTSFTLPKGCQRDTDCGDDASCLTHLDIGTCVCAPGAFKNQHRCVRSSFTDRSCEYLSDDHQFCGGGNGLCLGGECHCDSGFFASEGKCMPRAGVNFSEEICHSRTASCRNGVCRSPEANGHYACMCNQDFIPYPKHTHELKHCVPADGSDVDLQAQSAKSAASRDYEPARLPVLIAVLIAVLTFVLNLACARLVG